MKQVNQIHKTQKGISLTEVLLALMVGSALMVIAYSGYKMAISEVSVSSQTKGTIQLIGAIKRTFGIGNTYSAVTAVNVINSQIVPDDFKTDSTTIYNAWGGVVTPSVGTPTTTFNLVVTNVPSQACVSYVAGLQGTAHIIWVNGSTAGTHDVKSSNGAYHPDRAATQCSAAATATVTIVVR